MKVGKGVEKLIFDKNTNLKELYEKLIENNQLLIEECIDQHDEMNRLYDKSVNTMRMFTFYKDGESFFLQAVLKIGNRRCCRQLLFWWYVYICK